jgi:RNA polymerase sigma-70 factor (ECF subfamily)
MDSSFHQANWRDCYQRLAPRLLLYARQWVPSLADAEDVVQTAFVRFWRHQPEAGSEHYPLLYAAVRTSALDLLRTHDRRARREADDRVLLPRGDGPWFDASIERREEAEAIEAALSHLPATQREVIVLKIWGDLTFAQISEALNESINTIASRYRYGLEALRRHLKPADYEPV